MRRLHAGPPFHPGMEARRFHLRYGRLLHSQPDSHGAGMANQELLPARALAYQPARRLSVCSLKSGLGTKAAAVFMRRPRYQRGGSRSSLLAFLGGVVGEMLDVLPARRKCVILVRFGHRRLDAPLHPGLNYGLQPLVFIAAMLFVAFLELRDDGFAEQFERFANVLMLEFARLRDEIDLIDSGRFVIEQDLADFIRRADATGRAAVAADNPDQFGERRVAKRGPQVGLRGTVKTVDIVMPEAVAEERAVLGAQLARGGAVVMAHKAGQEADVGIDRVTNRGAGFQRRIVVARPFLRVAGGEEAEGQRADSHPGGHHNRFLARAGDPQRRMRLLDRLG